MKRICVFQSVSTALRVSEKRKKGTKKNPILLAMMNEKEQPEMNDEGSKNPISQDHWVWKRSLYPDMLLVLFCFWPIGKWLCLLVIHQVDCLTYLKYCLLFKSLSITLAQFIWFVRMGVRGVTLCYVHNSTITRKARFCTINGEGGICKSYWF